MKSAFKKSTMGLGIASAFCAATPASALESGRCLPIADMNNALRADNQRTIVIGNRTETVEVDVPDRHGMSRRDYDRQAAEFRTTEGRRRYLQFLRQRNPNASAQQLQRDLQDAITISEYRSQLPAQTEVRQSSEVITSNSDGSLGYSLSGDKPRETSAVTVCVRARLSDVRLFDARLTTIPHDAYLGGSFDRLVDNNASRGFRPMVVANTVFPDGNGGTRLGRPIVLFGNVQLRSASLTTYTGNGETAELAAMVSTDYTPVAIERLNGQSPAP